MTSYGTLQLLAAIAATNNTPQLSLAASVNPTGIVNVRVDEDDEETMPWEKEGWVPRMPNGQPKSASMIREELQRYIDSSDKSQTYIINNELLVNNNSFRKFMNPKSYKNQWSATQNGTYWAAARLLERRAYEKKHAKKRQASVAKAAAAAPPTKKRKSTGRKSSDGAPAKQRPVTSSKMESYMSHVQLVTLPEDSKVYDSCQEVIAKIKEFLKRDGVTKACFCRILGDLNHNSVNRFLKTKDQAGAGMVAYERAYEFFERMRILENRPKTQERIQNEMLQPEGFVLKNPNRGSNDDDDDDDDEVVVEPKR